MFTSTVHIYTLKSGDDRIVVITLSYVSYHPSAFFPPFWETGSAKKIIQTSTFGGKNHAKIEHRAIVPLP